MSLREEFAKFINEYSEIYAEVNKTQNYRHPFGSFIRNDRFWQLVLHYQECDA